MARAQSRSSRGGATARKLQVPPALGRAYMTLGLRRLARRPLCGRKQEYAMERDKPLNFLGDDRQIAVERAVAEFRAARPIAIRSPAKTVLAFPVDGMDARLMAFLHKEKRHPRLSFRARNATRRERGSGRRPLCGWSPSRSKTWRPISPITVARARKKRLRTRRKARRWLSLIWRCSCPPRSYGRQPKGAARAASHGRRRGRVGLSRPVAGALKIVSRAFVPLEGAGSCEFVVFRGGDGFATRSQFRRRSFSVPPCRADPLGAPDRPSLRHLNAIAATVARHGRGDGEPGRRRGALSRSGRTWKRHRDKVAPTACRTRASTPTTPTNCRLGRDQRRSDSLRRC